jgi:hypothetical protein
MQLGWVRARHLPKESMQDINKVCGFNNLSWTGVSEHKSKAVDVRYCCTVETHGQGSVVPQQPDEELLKSTINEGFGYRDLVKLSNKTVGGVLLMSLCILFNNLASTNELIHDSQCLAIVK